MKSTFTAVVLALSSIISSSSATNDVVDQHSKSAAQCTTYTVSLNITSQNYIFDIKKFKNDFDLINVVTDITRKDSNVSFHPVTGIENVTAVYTINGTFCSPKTPSHNGREKTVLLATHGIAYDGRYWNAAYKPQEYSFVEAMAKAGYSVFYYDRLGTGNSQTVSGYINQASIQVAIAANLARLLRAGQYTSAIGIPKSLVLVGHSYGSLISNIILAKFPALADAAVLTGIAYAPLPSSMTIFLASQALRIASLQNPTKYGHLDTGYVTFADTVAHVNTFFKAPAYEVGAVEYAQSVSAPAALTEFLSATAGPFAPNFGGPVLVTAGEFDLPFCGGECYSTFAEQRLDVVFPKSRLPLSFVHPGAGHGVNFGKNATGFYGGISAFLERAGF